MRRITSAIMLSSCMMLGPVVMAQTVLKSSPNRISKEQAANIVNKMGIGKVQRATPISERNTFDVTVKRGKDTFRVEVDSRSGRAISASGPALADLQRDSEPCPTSGDDFLGQPGRIIGAPFPPNNAYVVLSFEVVPPTRGAPSLPPQRVLVKQSGRVVARFYGDLNDPRRKAAFVSDGTDVEYEFEQCIGNSWYPYVNYFTNQSSPPNMQYLMEGGNTRFTLRWGPQIVPPAPPAQPVFLHLAGKLNCGGFAWRVATSYAYAWVTSTPDPNGPAVAVRKITAKMYIGCRRFPHQVSAENTSRTEAMEQFRGIGVPVCCDFEVRGEAITMDGRTLTAGPITIKESD